MGYAKYSEDIVRTHSQNVFGTFLDYPVGNAVPHYPCSLCSFQAQKRDELEAHVIKSHKDAAVFLEYDDQIIADNAVFKVRPIHLKVRCPALPDGVSVELKSIRRSGSKTIMQDGQLLTITPPDEEVVVVQFVIGAYQRNFGISFKHRLFHARLTRYFLEIIEEANNSINAWTWSDIQRLEITLDGEASLSLDEQEHRRAVYQYYLALWLEQNEKQEYGRHYEEAFQVLRNFSDPFAQLITNYFLYRVNCFSAISPVLAFPQLRQVIAFFDPAGELDRIGFIPTGGKHSEFVPCVISITDVDRHIFDAVIAYNQGDYNHCLSSCEAAEHVISATDEPTKHRLRLLRFRSHRALQHGREARYFADRLLSSSTESFKKEAENFLRSI